RTGRATLLRLEVAGSAGTEALLLPGAPQFLAFWLSLAPGAGSQHWNKRSTGSVRLHPSECDREGQSGHGPSKDRGQPMSGQYGPFPDVDRFPESEAVFESPEARLLMRGVLVPESRQVPDGRLRSPS